MPNNEILKRVEEIVKKQCENDSTGHDWTHVDRVRKIALLIAKKEGGDPFIIELAALLHDVEDWKTKDAGSGKAAKILEQAGADKDVTNYVVRIISKISFKGIDNDDKMGTIEGKIVQDADRLDAIGAIGIVRTCYYSANRGRRFYDPAMKPDVKKVKDINRKTTAINHFYEKLLLLRDRMNTETAKKMAEKRHLFMEAFLKQFKEEWDGK